MQKLSSAYNTQLAQNKHSREILAYALDCNVSFCTLFELFEYFKIKKGERAA